MKSANRLYETIVTRLSVDPDALGKQAIMLYDRFIRLSGAIIVYSQESDVGSVRVILRDLQLNQELPEGQKGRLINCINGWDDDYSECEI